MSNKKFTYIEIGLHIIFWIVYVCFPIIKFGHMHWFDFNIVDTIITASFLAASVYIWYAILEKSKGISPLMLVGIVSSLALVYLSCKFNLDACGCTLSGCLINKGVEFLFVHFFFTAIYSLRKNFTNRQKIQQIQQERTAAELKSLKAQMNPHFLFNTLNMLYSNAMVKDEVLAGKILMLSDSLHYLMHEGDKKEVTAEKEIEFLQGYIALQKARLGAKVAIDFKTQVSNFTIKIPPLLMLPFVENAFKYAAMKEGKQVPITIDIMINTTEIALQVTNDFDPDYAVRQEKQWKESGIGIQNVTRRLQLLYPNNHELKIDRNNQKFKVTLNIKR